MRRPKRDRAKPIPRSDLDQVAKLRAELEVYAELKSKGWPHRAALLNVWGDEYKPASPPPTATPAKERK